MQNIPGAVLVKRREDNKDVIILIVEAAADRNETERRLARARVHFEQLKPHVNRIELQIPQHLNSNAMRKAMRRLAIDLKAV